jgi:hypothetical protein
VDSKFACNSDPLPRSAMGFRMTQLLWAELDFQPVSAFASFASHRPSRHDCSLPDGARPIVSPCPFMEQLCETGRAARRSAAFATHAINVLCAGAPNPPRPASGKKVFAFAPEQYGKGLPTGRRLRRAQNRAGR